MKGHSAQRSASLPKFVRSLCRLGAVFGLFWTAVAVGADGPDAPAPIVLRDATVDSGIDFVHTDGSTGKRYIVETVTAGLALFDYDGDGRIDIYFLNGAPIERSDPRRRSPPTNRLYRNAGDWRFTDVTVAAGVDDTGFSLGVAAADYDNDGDEDLFVNNWGPDVLYRNNGDGTFTNVARRAGIQQNDKVGAGAAFLDIDRDGLLDLFAANYVQFKLAEYAPTIDSGLHLYPGPKLFKPDVAELYHNEDGGRFREMAAEAGIGAHAGSGMGVVAADYDSDGDTDIFVCNDVRANFLFQNDGQGKFEEAAVYSGTAFDVDGEENGSMGVDCADYNNDSLLDFYMTNYQDEIPVLYENAGGGFFEDVSNRTGAGEGARPHVTWGTGLVDFDNDGHRDIFIACGHLYDNVELFDDRTAYRAANILLRNDGRGKFVNISDQAGDGMRPKQSSRGAAFDDLDNDGDVDAVILNSREKPTILRNDSPGGNHWLQIELHGVRCNRGGIGTQVKVVAGDLAQLAEVHSGRGYQSHFGTRLQFGLGRHAKVDRIEVRWLGGGTDVLEDVAVDRRITIVETPPADGG